MLPVAADIVGEAGEHFREGILVAQHLILQALGVHHAHQLGESRRNRRLDERLKKRAIEREIGLGNMGHRCEHALVFRLVAAKRADVVQRPGLAAHDPVAAHEIGAGRVIGLLFELGFVKAGR